LEKFSNEIDVREHPNEIKEEEEPDGHLEKVYSGKIDEKEQSGDHFEKE
jgi:hypothetical protein